VNSAEPPDTLSSQVDLDDFMTRFAYTGRYDRDEAELTAVRQLRPRLRRLLGTATGWWCRAPPSTGS
jgi:hypothetical protein